MRILDESEGNDFCRDGESIRAEMTLMDAMPVFDSAGHRPGSLSLTDAELDRRADMYDAQKARISSRSSMTLPLAKTTGRCPRS